MPNKIALLLTNILVIVDVSLLLDYAYRPVQDTHHEILGEGLMDMFAIGFAGFLILYLLIFLLLHFRKKFTAAKVLSSILLVMNIIFLGQVILSWFLSH